MHGKLEAAQHTLRVLPPDRRVQVLLHVKTPFEQHKIVLEVEQQEEDAQGPKGKLVSGNVEDQLQRAIMFVACCLSSGNDELQKMGDDVMERIHQLER